MLKKEYKYVAPESAASQTPDKDGITDSMLDFSWERDVKTSVSHCCLNTKSVVMSTYEMITVYENQLERR